MSSSASLRASLKPSFGRHEIVHRVLGEISLSLHKQHDKRSSKAIIVFLWSLFERF
jgi:hypothetical protein